MLAGGQGILKRPVESFRDYMTIRDAAEYLGVSPSTLRNWDRTGKVKTIRHPVNNYRLYRTKDLDVLLSAMKSVTGESGRK